MNVILDPSMGKNRIVKDLMRVSEGAEGTEYLQLTFVYLFPKMHFHRTVSIVMALSILLILWLFYHYSGNLSTYSKLGKKRKNKNLSA